MFTEPPRRVLEGRMGIVVGTPAGLYAEFAGGDFVGQEPERRIPRSARLRVVDLLGSSTRCPPIGYPLQPTPHSLRLGVQRGAQL